MKAAVCISFAAFFLILGAAAILIGWHDAALTRASLGVRAGGAMLLVFGVVLWFAAYHLVKPIRGSSRSYPSTGSSWTAKGEDPLREQLVFIAFLLIFLVGLSVLFSAMRTAGAQRWVVVVVGGAFMVVALLGLFLFRKNARVTLPRLGAIALGLIATSIGAWEFWYQNQYVPSRAGSAVVLRVDLRRAGQQRAYDVIRATLEYEDVGGRSVSVIGSTYTLTGSRVVGCHRRATVREVRHIFKSFLTDPQRTRFMADVWEKEPPTVLAAGKFVGDGKRLDQNVSSSRGYVFLVPHRHYQLLRFRAQLFAIPASVQLSQRTRPTYTNFDAKENFRYGFWRVDDDSWLHALLYGRERWVVVRYEFVDPSNKMAVVRSPKLQATSPDLRVTARFPDPTWTVARPSKADVKSLFERAQPGDSSEPFAGTEVALGGVAEPTAAEIEDLKARGVTCSTAAKPR